MDTVYGCCVSIFLFILGGFITFILPLYRTIRTIGKSAEQSAMERLLSDLQTHPLAWAFLQPVNGEEVQDYYEVIKQPMGEIFSLSIPITFAHHWYSRRLCDNGA